MMFGSLLLEWFCINLIWCLCSEKENFVTQSSLTVADCQPHVGSLNTISPRSFLYINAELHGNLFLEISKQW